MMLSMICACCGEPVQRSAREHRSAVKNGRGNRVFCSRNCAAKQGARERHKNGSRTVFGVEALSSREVECAKLAARSMSDKEIARELQMSPNTVRTHLGNIFKKLHITNRRDLISFFEDDAAAQTPISDEQILTFDKMAEKIRDTVRLTASGVALAQIAEQHGVSINTIRDRRERIVRFLKARNRRELITLWHQYEKHKQEASDECRRQHADRVSA